MLTFAISPRYSCINSQVHQLQQSNEKELIHAATNTGVTIMPSSAVTDKDFLKQLPKPETGDDTWWETLLHESTTMGGRRMK